MSEGTDSSSTLAEKEDHPIIGISVHSLITEIEKLTNEVEKLRGYQKHFEDSQEKCIALQTEIKTLKEEVIKELKEESFMLKKHNAELTNAVAQLETLVRKLKEDDQKSKQRISHLEEKMVKRDSLVKAADLISLFAFYYCSNWMEFCEQYATITADREDDVIDQVQFEKQIKTVITKYFADSRTHDHIPTIMQIKLERNTLSYSDIRSAKKQNDFLSSFSAFDAFQPSESDALKKILAILQSTKLKRKV